MFSEILLFLEKTYFKMTVIRLKYVDKRVLMEGYLGTGFGSFLAADRVSLLWFIAVQ